MKHLFTLNRYFVRYKWHLLLGILFVTGSNYFGILIPQKIREALDLVQASIWDVKNAEGTVKNSLRNGLEDKLLHFGLIVTGFVILKGILMYYMRQTIIVMSRLIEYDMRKEVYRHLQTLDQSYYRSHQTGDIMARISEDVSKVRNYLGPGILYGINLVSLFIMTIYVMLQVDVTLTLFTLLPLPILSISIYYVSNLINKKSSRIQQQLSVLTNTAQETYSGIRVVKSYRKEEDFVQFFSVQSDEFRNRALDLSKTEAWFQPLMVLLIALSTLLVVFIGGYRVEAGQLTAGNIAEFILYVNMLTWPVTSIGWIASIIQEAEASQARINEILSEKPNIQNTNDTLYPVLGNITFRNVGFVYPDTGIRALSTINFTVRKGQRLAIFGKTGSGKTTIAELMVRLFDPTEGEILLDGKNLTEHNLNIVRDRIACVPQDVFLFSDTVKDNISFGKEDISTEQIYDVAASAAVKADIDQLPSGFDTVVGERGVTLSGGQKQRISIARAFIRQPDVVILDDVLSAVDTHTEQQILSYFSEALADKTAIVITHRANNLLNYDHIIILEGGRIVDEGTHEELIQRDGYYRTIYDQQMMKSNLLEKN